jgi:hypothetical protein
VHRLPIVVLSAFALACASGGSKSASSTAAVGTASTSEHNSTRLTLEEITSANLPTAYDLVDRLRRPWLRRDAATGGDVVVYMDERNIGGAEALREIPSVDVAELQYLQNADAVKHWGGDVKGSVIVVSRRR